MTPSSSSPPPAAAAACEWWPKEVAGRVRFLVPEGWEEGNQHEEEHQQKLCRLEYDESRNLLLVVVDVVANQDEDEEEKTTILDCIDPEDMIGAKLEVSLKEETFEKDGQQQEEEELSGRDDNEPSSDDLTDRRGSAALCLYSYPRVADDDDPGGAAKGWFAWATSGIRGGSDQVPPPSHRVPNPSLYRRKKKDEESEEGDAEERPNKRSACHRRLTLAPAEDLGDASLLVEALRRLSCAGDGAASESSSESDGTRWRHRRRRLLVLVNPNAGPQKAGEQLYEDTVKPMLEDQAGIDCDVVVTLTAEDAVGRLCERRMANAAAAAIGDGGDEKDAAVGVGSGESLADDDVSRYDGVVVLGGDGTMHQAVNAILHERGSGKSGDGDGSGAAVLRTVPLALVGCGSANGFPASVAFESSEACGEIETCYLIWCVLLIPPSFGLPLEVSMEDYGYFLGAHLSNSFSLHAYAYSAKAERSPSTWRGTRRPTTSTRDSCTSAGQWWPTSISSRSASASWGSSDSTCGRC